MASFEIETSALDGTDKRRLTEKAGLDVLPKWSPDGGRIAFLRYDDYKCGVFESEGIYTMKANGSDVRRIVSVDDVNDRHAKPGERLGGSVESSFTWSPDGRAIAFLMEEGARTLNGGETRWTSLNVTKADGSDQTRLLVGEKRWRTERNYFRSDFGSPPAWSSDSQRIAFLKLDDGRPKLYTIGRDGRGLREVADPVAVLPDISYSGKVSWSPDGSQILFSIAQILFSLTLPDPLVRASYVVNVDGSDLRVLRSGFHGIMSPDGTRVAALRGVDVVLYTTALDGSDMRVLVRKGDGGVLEAVGPEQRPTADVASCSAGVVVPDPEANPGLVRDCEALVGMIDRTPAIGLSWDADTPIAEWEGVTLEAPVLEGGSDSGEPLFPLRVRGLSLSNRGLIGAFPLKVTELTGLWSLKISGNNLSGAIPPEVGRLTSLRVLRLNEEKLTGPIPPELGNLAGLQVLSLGARPGLGSLTGPIPPELGRLADLRELTLVGRLNGPLPPELGSLTALETLDLSWNNLTGPLPPELGSLTALEKMDLSYNELTGPLPPELGNLTALKELYLRHNQLSGPIPREMYDLRSLERVKLSHSDICRSQVLDEQIEEEAGRPEWLQHPLHIGYCD